MTQHVDVMQEQWQKHLEQASHELWRQKMRPWIGSLVFCFGIALLFLSATLKRTTVFSQHLNKDNVESGESYGFCVHEDVIGKEVTLQIWHSQGMMQQYRNETSRLKEVEHFEWIGRNTAFYLHLTLESPGDSVNAEESARLIYDFRSNRFFSPENDLALWQSYDVIDSAPEKGILTETAFRKLLKQYKTRK